MICAKLNENRSIIFQPLSCYQTHTFIHVNMKKSERMVFLGWGPQHFYRLIFGIRSSMVMLVAIR